MALESEIPTLAEFLARFPTFAGGDNNDAIELLIPEAAREVADGWIVEDQHPAILYLTAHMLTMEGDDFDGRITSESFGPMSTSYKSTEKEYTETEYGRRWLKYLRRNSHGILAVGGDLT